MGCSNGHLFSVTGGSRCMNCDFGDEAKMRLRSPDGKTDEAEYQPNEKGEWERTYLQISSGNRQVSSD